MTNRPAPSLHYLAREDTREAWIEARLSPEWTAAYRLALQDGALVVAELRIYPRQDDAALPLGEWRGMTSGLQASVPSGGLTSGIIKAATIGQHVRHAREPLEKLAQALKGRGRVTSVDISAGTRRTIDLAAHPLVRQLQPLLVGPTPMKRADGSDTSSLYVAVAEAYARGLSAVAIADRLKTRIGKGTSPAYVTQMIYAARHRFRFLQPTSGRGIAGRALTAAGRAAFAAAPAALQRIATEGVTGGYKTPQVPKLRHKKARQSTRRNRRA